MRRIKEYLAWGGCDLAALKSNGVPRREACARAWPVHPEVFQFIVDGYLRGWGVTGGNVDLDLGTAIFARTQRNLWNS